MKTKIKEQKKNFAFIDTTIKILLRDIKKIKRSFWILVLREA